MRYLLFVLMFFSFIGESYSQLKINDLSNFPLGIYFDQYTELKSHFTKEPFLFKGDSKTNKDNYKVEYNDTPFDIFGSADYEFVFVNKTLAFIEIKYKFNYDETEKFRQTIQSLRHTLNTISFNDSTMRYNDLDYLEAINFMKKEGKGVYGKMEDSVWENLNNENFGSEFWEIKKSKQNDSKLIILAVSVGSTHKPRYDSYNRLSGYDYSGSCLFLNITLTNFKLQDLRNQFLSQSGYNFTGFKENKKNIELKNENGVFKIPVIVNNIVMLDFVLDLGAADVSISSDLYSVLVKTGSIDKNDILGKQSYKLADGSIVENIVVNLKSLTIGEINLENVKASVSNSDISPLLLGQSALKKLGKYSIDNKKNVLIIE